MNKKATRIVASTALSAVLALSAVGVTSAFAAGPRLACDGSSKDPAYAQATDPGSATSPSSAHFAQ